MSILDDIVDELNESFDDLLLDSDLEAPDSMECDDMATTVVPGEMLTTVKRKMKIGVKHKQTEDKCPSRRMSVMSGIDFDEEFICPRAVALSSEMITDAHFQDDTPSSPNASTTDLLQRANSVDSEISSGFGGSNGYLKLDSDESSCSHQDLLETLDNLRREINFKDARIRDVEDYLDKLVARVMEHNPELLAGPLVPNGKTGRDIASPFAEHSSVH